MHSLKNFFLSFRCYCHQNYRITKLRHKKCILNKFALNICLKNPTDKIALTINPMFSVSTPQILLEVFFSPTSI